MLKVDLSPNDLLSIGGRTRHLANPSATVRSGPELQMSADDKGATSFSFTSILFPPGIEQPPPTATEPPACFIDLNLDQVVSAMADKRDEDVLRPIFYASYRDVDIARYRQAVFTDLDRSDVFQAFPTFCDAMQTVRANLNYAGKISYKCHRHMVILRAIGLYCDTVTSLASNLASFALELSGLRSLQAYLQTYINSLAHSRLATETRELQDIISKLSYGMLFRGDKATLRKYADEPDYTATILERFERFRETHVKPPAPPRPKDDFSLNHIEEGILEFVGRLFAREFRTLAEYVARHTEFIDGAIARFDREIGFFIAYRTFIDPLKELGLPFCYPDVSATSKETEVTGSFDLALAAKLLRENRAVISNDFFLHDPERLLVVSGPNQGGKTTFARMFGQLHFLAGLGCPVPGQQARLFLPDRIFTHFEREEDITNLRGKLEDELVRLHETCQSMTSDSVIILNEIFNSTSLDDQILLSTKILESILATDAIGLCVTFVDSLSRLSEKTASMVSTVTPEDPAQRTFLIIRKPADGLAYALSLAEKRGVTYEQLRTRVRP